MADKESVVEIGRGFVELDLVSNAFLASEIEVTFFGDAIEVSRFYDAVSRGLALAIERSLVGPRRKRSRLH